MQDKNGRCDDLKRLDAGRNSFCGIMKVDEVRNVKISHGLNHLDCDVVETGELHETSHAGIIVYINGQHLVGGHEAEIQIKGKAGESLDALVLAMQHRLASLAQKGLTHVYDLI